MPSPTVTQLSEILKAEAAATPGEWSPMLDGPNLDREPWEPWQATMEAAPGLTLASPTNTEPIVRVSGYLQPVVANAHLIALSRNHIKELVLAELRRLDGVPCRALAIAGFALALLVAQAAQAPEARCGAVWCPNMTCFADAACGDGCRCHRLGGSTRGRCASR